MERMKKLLLVAGLVLAAPAAYACGVPSFASHSEPAPEPVPVKQDTTLTMAFGGVLVASVLGRYALQRVS